VTLPIVRPGRSWAGQVRSLVYTLRHSRSLAPPFPAHAGGTYLIPTRFSVPVRQEPLFQFWGFRRETCVDAGASGMADFVLPMRTAFDSLFANVLRLTAAASHRLCSVSRSSASRAPAKTVGEVGLDDCN
jgi:hypothetical protein